MAEDEFASLPELPEPSHDASRRQEGGDSRVEGGEDDATTARTIMSALRFDDQGRVIMAADPAAETRIHDPHAEPTPGGGIGYQPMVNEGADDDAAGTQMAMSIEDLAALRGADRRHDSPPEAMPEPAPPAMPTEFTPRHPQALPQGAPPAWTAATREPPAPDRRREEIGPIYHADHGLPDDVRDHSRQRRVLLEMRAEVIEFDRMVRMFVTCIFGMGLGVLAAWAIGHHGLIGFLAYPLQLGGSIYCVYRFQLGHVGAVATIAGLGVGLSLVLAPYYGEGSINAVSVFVWIGYLIVAFMVSWFAEKD
jgi:hypothetical protein